MQCPACKTVNLAMTDRQGIEIDYCPQCRGVWLDRGELDRLIERAGLPILSPDLGVDAWISHMGHDKKVEEGQLRFVLLRQLGQAVIEKGVPLTVLREVLQGRFIRRA